MLVKSRLPRVIGKIQLHPEEFCYHVYMPVKIEYGLSAPESLSWTIPLLDMIPQYHWIKYKYWYLTVKHMYVSGYGNRPGWHIDGFLTDGCFDKMCKYALDNYDKLHHSHVERLITKEALRAGTMYHITRDAYPHWCIRMVNQLRLQQGC